MTKHQYEKSCAPDYAGYDISDQRQRYFEGKYMTARDFRDEQRYFLSHRHAHNRLLHGWGVVCGLRVDGLDRDGCRDRWIKINSGYALDCYGRELVVQEELCIELPDKKTVEAWEHAGLERQLEVQLADFPVRRPNDDQNPHAAAAASFSEVEYLIGLAYYAEKIEQVPALLDGECEPVHLEYNRVRETVRVIVVRRDQTKDCWIEKRKRQAPMSFEDCVKDAPIREDCDDDAPGPAGTCLEPDCVCGQVVPLALVRARVTTDGYLVDDFRLLNKGQADREAEKGTRPAVTIEMDGRRRLPAPPSFLTHITCINWPHGGRVTLEHVRETMNGRLEIQFDRKILEADGFRTGISRHTLIVTYGGAQGDEELVPFDPKAPPRLVGDDRAVFKIRPEYLRRRNQPDNLDNSIIRIRLLCDFILDCHDNAVDGNHLGGELPTGNGVQGGVFESWFMIGEPIKEREDEEEEED